MINKKAFQWKGNLKDNYWQYIKRGWEGALSHDPRLLNMTNTERITVINIRISRFTVMNTKVKKMWGFENLNIVNFFLISCHASTPMFSLLDNKGLISCHTTFKIKVALLCRLRRSSGNNFSR